MGIITIGDDLAKRTSAMHGMRQQLCRHCSWDANDAVHRAARATLVRGRSIRWFGVIGTKRKRAQPQGMAAAKLAGDAAKPHSRRLRFQSFVATSETLFTPYFRVAPWAFFEMNWYCGLSLTCVTRNPAASIAEV